MREVKTTNSVCSFVYKILGYHMNLVSIFICRGPWKTFEPSMLPLPFPYGGLIFQWAYILVTSGEEVDCHWGVVCRYVVWRR